MLKTLLVECTEFDENKRASGVVGVEKFNIICPGDDFAGCAFDS